MSISTDQWQAWDPNPLTAAALAAAEDPSALLATRLAFGTAGLRGPMAPGTNAMNDLMVIQTTQGLAKYLLAHFGPAPEGSKHQVVIGYDHRCAEQWGLSSERFARLTAAVLTEAGLEPLVLDGLVPTPLVAFATKKLERCVAGVMVTASHNPAADNGYKVYWNQGVQFTPPHDAGIAAEILAQLEPWAVYSPEGVQLATAFTAEIAEQYYGEMKASLCRGIPSEAPLKVLYTAMHGVGLPWVQRAFAQFELPAMLLEESQCAPDASFATVAFPNPEEKGALDRAMATGTKEGAHLIIANDPDADRLAVAEAEEGGGWRVFTGNEIGALLAHWMLMSCKTERSKIAMLASTVSSKMLGAIAKAEGCKFEDTLTGFKWLGRRADELRAEGYDVVFAYEEAIGFACGDLISDKDGVSAAAVFTEMAAQEYNAGRTVSSLLQSLYRQYGEFVSCNSYFFCHDPKVARAIVDSWCTGPGQYLSSVAGYEVTAVRDLGSGAYDSTTADNKPLLPTSNSSPMVTFSFANGTVATFRTSGTEPKFKYYIEMAGKPGVPREQVQAELDAMVPPLLQALVQPDKHGLQAP